MSRILISGATGFIGKALASHFASQGHTIVKLSRQRAEEGAIVWDPEAGKVRREDLEGFDWVIHLAGDPFTLNHWSEEKKMKLFSSRVEGTRLLSQTLAQAQR